MAAVVVNRRRPDGQHPDWFVVASWGVSIARQAREQIRRVCGNPIRWEVETPQDATTTEPGSLTSGRLQRHNGY